MGGSPERGETTRTTIELIGPVDRRSSRPSKDLAAALAKCAGKKGRSGNLTGEDSQVTGRRLDDRKVHERPLARITGEMDRHALGPSISGTPPRPALASTSKKSGPKRPETRRARR
jgi:hypothetical protein